jgi:hypothetical protein
MFGAAVVACTLALAPGVNTPDSSAVLERAAFHVRSTDPRAQAWIRAGAEGSPTFRDLLNRLSDSDLIVYVEIVDRINGAVGHTYMVTSTASVRYVRIEVVPVGNFVEMIALVGHELQHAVEIAGAPRVRDRATLAQFYLAMSENMNSGSRYDSAEARVTEDRVKRELVSYSADRAVPADHAHTRFKQHN